MTWIFLITFCAFCVAWYQIGLLKEAIGRIKKGEKLQDQDHQVIWGLIAAIGLIVIVIISSLK
jgi:hypothetical protein